jgi:hypothetical protein
MSAPPLQPIVQGQYLGSSAASLYASPAGTVTRIDKLTVCNSSGSSVTVTFYLVPSGSSIGGDNTSTFAQAISAGSTWNSPNEYGLYLGPGDAFWGLCSAASSASVFAAGTQATG